MGTVLGVGWSIVVEGFSWGRNGWFEVFVVVEVRFFVGDRFRTGLWSLEGGVERKLSFMRGRRLGKIESLLIVGVLILV